MLNYDTGIPWQFLTLYFLLLWKIHHNYRWSIPNHTPDKKYILVHNQLSEIKHSHKLLAHHHMNTAVLTQSCPTCLCALPVSEFLSAIDSLLAAERWVGEAGVTDIHNPVVRDFLPLSSSAVPPINNPSQTLCPTYTDPSTYPECLSVFNFQSYHFNFSKG